MVEGGGGQDRLRIDPVRMLREIEAIAAIDRRSDGSCCRLALTDSDRR